MEIRTKNERIYRTLMGWSALVLFLLGLLLLFVPLRAGAEAAGLSIPGGAADNGGAIPRI